MARRPPDPETSAEVLNSPTYWFAVMELARDAGRFLQAQHALDELRRLGVLVRFVPPGNPRRGPTHAA